MRYLPPLAPQSCSLWNHPEALSPQPKLPTPQPPTLVPEDAASHSVGAVDFWVCTSSLQP
eukprot:3099593-Rhodomonas_salina.1